MEGFNDEGQGNEIGWVGVHITLSIQPQGSISPLLLLLYKERCGTSISGLFLLPTYSDLGHPTINCQLPGLCKYLKPCLVAPD